MIKKIHYCWFGSNTPQSVQLQVQRWQELCPDYQIIEWNNHNCDVPQYDFWNRMIREKRFGFASDIASFQKVYEEGGFYMDCDVELKKTWDDLQAPDDHFILGYMYDCAISGGVFYAPPKHKFLGLLLDYYKDISSDFYPVNNTILTHLINNNIEDFRLNGRFYTSDKHKVTVYPKEYFCQPSLIHGKSFAIDQFAGSWKTPGKEFTTSRGETSAIRTIRRKLGLLRMLFKNEFRTTYLAALLGKKRRDIEYWRTRYNRKGGAITPNEIL